MDEANAGCFRGMVEPLHRHAPLISTKGAASDQSVTGAALQVSVLVHRYTSFLLYIGKFT